MTVRVLCKQIKFQRLRSANWTARRTSWESRRKFSAENRYSPIKNFPKVKLRKFQKLWRHPLSTSIARRC